MLTTTRGGLTAHAVGRPGPGLASVEARWRLCAPAPGVSWHAAQMALRGTPAHSRVEFAAALDALGARLTFSATQAGAAASLVVPTAALEAASPLLAAALSPTVAQEEMAALTRRVAGWWAGVAGEPRQHAALYLSRLAGEGTPFAFPAMGRPQDAVNLSAPQVRAFAQEAWRWGDAHLAVVSNLPPEESLAALEPVLAHTQGDTPAPPPLPQGWGRRGFLHSATPGAVVVARWPAPPRTHPDWPDLVTAVEVLGGGMGSLLYRGIRRRRGLAYAVGMRPGPARRQGAFALHLETDPARLPEALDATTATLAQAGRRLAKGRIAEAVRTRRLGRWLAIEGTGDLASRLAAESDLSLPPLSTMAEPDHLSLNPKRLSALARRWLDPARATWVVGADAEALNWPAMAKAGWPRSSFTEASGLAGALGESAG